MNVIMRGGPQMADLRRPNGRSAPGELVFEAQVYAPGEEDAVWDKTKRPPTPAEWLRQQDSRGMVLVPGPSGVPGVAAIAVPAKLLSALPPDAGVVMEWTWRRRSK